jgi:hypothetical protein
LVDDPLAPSELQIVLDHHPDQLRKADPPLPAESIARLARVAAQLVHLCRPEISRIDLDVAAPVEPGRREGELDEIAHAVRLAGRNDVIIGLLLLQHQPHRLDIVAGKAPIPPCIEVPQVKLVLQTVTDAPNRSRRLARDEGLAATRALMVEQNAVADEEPIGFAVVDRKPMRRHLADAIGAARVKRRPFALGRRGGAEHLRGTGLIATHRAAAVEHMVAHRLDQSQRADGDHVGGVFGDLEGDLDVALGAEVVNLVGIDSFEHPPQTGAVGQVAVVQGEPWAAEMGIVVKMIYPVGVEEARPPHQAVNLITLREQELGKIGAVLPGDAGDQRTLCHIGGYYRVLPAVPVQKLGFRTGRRRN